MGRWATLIIILLIVYLPVVYGLKDALFDDYGRFTLEYVSAVLSRRSLRNALRFTLIQAFLSSVLATLLGFLAALALLSMGFRGARVLRALSMVPFMAPPMVVVTGFTALFGVNGVFSTRFPFLKVFGDGFWAIIAAHVFYNIPLALNFVYASLVSFSRDIVEAVEVFSGGNFRTVFRRVILPFSLPSLASAFVLTFIYCFTSFAIPLSLGGVQYSTLETYIYYYFKIIFDHHRAAAVALIQYLILLFLVVFFVRLHGRVGAPVGVKHYQLTLPSSIRRGFIFYLFMVFLYLYFPLLVIPYYALLNPYTSSFSLNGFSRVLSLSYDPGLGVVTGVIYINTFYYAFVTGVLAPLLASLLVFLGGEWVDTFFVSLLAVSPLTLSLGLVRTYGFLPNPLLIIVSHTIASLPLVVRVLRVGVERVPRVFLEVARVLGERGLPLYARVFLPLMKPSYLVAISLSLVVSLGEFSATLFISTPSTTTLGIAVYRYRGVRDWRASAAAATILLSLTSIILLALSRRVERWL